MTLREAAVVALEALEVGDQDSAVEALLNGLEDELPRAERARCEFCGQRFEWPGLLEAHHDRGCASELEAARLSEAA